MACRTCIAALLISPAPEEAEEEGEGNHHPKKNTSLSDWRKILSAKQYTKGAHSSGASLMVETLVLPPETKTLLLILNDFSILP